MKYVCTGATLKCTMGTASSKLVATPKDVSLTGQDQANVADYVPMKNVPGFGRCRSLRYHPTAAATAANQGKLTPMPCVPGTCQRWKTIDRDSLICGEPALLEPATLQCMYGGTISIVNPGQSLEIKIRGVSFSQKSESQQEEAVQEIPEELLQEFNSLDRSGLTTQSVLDGVQAALDVLGMVPGVGAIPDLMNAAISVMRGDWVGAGLSIVAAVPVVGDAVGGAKIAYRGAKIATKSTKLTESVKVLMDKARNSGREVQSLAEDVAKKCGGYVTPLNFKTESSILRKMQTEQIGPNKIKDAVRTTIIAPKDKIEDILKQISDIDQFQRIKRQKPEDFMGYSGNIVNIRTSNGLTAEIQVNTEKMIYAKEEPTIAKQILGEKRWNEIRGETGMEGGLGHKYYEQWRVLDKASDEALKIAQKSIEYYSHFQ